MAFLDSDYIDESFLEEIQCEYCANSFPLYLFSEHEDSCQGYNPALLGFVSETSNEEVAQDTDDDDDDDDEGETELKTSAEQENIKPLTKKEKIDSVIEHNLIQLAAELDRPKENTLLKTETPQKEKVKDNKELDNFFVSDFKVTDGDILEGNELLSFSSCTKDNKQLEEVEEKRSFKAVSDSFFKSVDSKPRIQNELTESDKEDGETLEEFWRRGEVALGQRKRKQGEIKVGRKAYPCK